MKQPTIPITDNLETILICAVRYACGRHTYMPGLVQDYIIGTCSGKLSKNTLAIMIRDIDEQIRYSKNACNDHGSQELFAHDLMFKLHDWCCEELQKLEDEVKPDHADGERTIPC